MAPSEIAVLCTSREITIFQVMKCVFNSSAPQINRQHWGYVRLLGPSEEFIGTEFIRFNRFPGRFQALRPVRLRADPVLPVITRNKVASRVSYLGNSCVLYCLHNVPAETILICQWVGRLIDTAVYNPPHMLQKTPIQPWVYLPDFICSIYKNLYFTHHDPPPRSLYY